MSTDVVVKNKRVITHLFAVYLQLRNLLIKRSLSLEI